MPRTPWLDYGGCPGTWLCQRRSRGQIHLQNQSNNGWRRTRKNIDIFPTSRWPPRRFLRIFGVVELTLRLVRSPAVGAVAPVLTPERLVLALCPKLFDHYLHLESSNLGAQHSRNGMIMLHSVGICIIFSVRKLVLIFQNYLSYTFVHNPCIKTANLVSALHFQFHVSLVPHE